MFTESLDRSEWIICVSEDGNHYKFGFNLKMNVKLLEGSEPDIPVSGNCLCLFQKSVFKLR